MENPMEIKRLTQEQSRFMRFTAHHESCPVCGGHMEYNTYRVVVNDVQCLRSKVECSAGLEPGADHYHGYSYLIRPLVTPLQPHFMDELKRLGFEAVMAEVPGGKR